MKIYVTFRLKFSILLNQYIFRIDTHEGLLLSSRAIQTNGTLYSNSTCFYFRLSFFASLFETKTRLTILYINGIIGYS